MHNNKVNFQIIHFVQNVWSPGADIREWNTSEIPSGKNRHNTISVCAYAGMV